MADPNASWEDMDEGQFAFMLAYFELVQRRLRYASWINGFVGTELPEGELRELLENICAKLQHELKMPPAQSDWARRRLFDKIFGATKTYYTINKK